MDWNVICQVCRRKIKASEAKKQWNGLIVCESDYEERHPLDMPQPVVIDEQPLPFTSPPLEPEYIYSCSGAGVSGIADYAVAECSICDNDTGVFDTLGVPDGTFSGSL